jgi:hypothetical protein
MGDTPAATWAAMRAEYVAGSEALTDVARRHGVLYSAAHDRHGRERWDDLRPRAPALPPAPPPWEGPPKRRGRPARPSPCCGYASIAQRARRGGEEIDWRCSRCGSGWTTRDGRPTLRVIEGGATLNPEAR